MQIYISGSLITVKNREEAHRFYEFLADVCIKLEHTPYLPHQNSDPISHNKLTNKEVFKKDLDALLKSDMILASITEPSTGVGAEIGIALEKNKQILAIYNKESTPSRFILGLLNHIGINPIIFTNEKDCEEQIIDYFNKNIMVSQL